MHQERDFEMKINFLKIFFTTLMLFSYFLFVDFIYKSNEMSFYINEKNCEYNQFPYYIKLAILLDKFFINNQILLIVIPLLLLILQIILDRISKRRIITYGYPITFFIIFLLLGILLSSLFTGVLLEVRLK